MCDPGDFQYVLFEVEIKITKIPAGPAPEWVRKEWVGLELLACLDKEENYMVDIDFALEVLESKSKSAALWFRQNLSLSDSKGSFIFQKEEAEIIRKCDHVSWADANR